ncbi:hypothetical protein LA080_007357 [Diaporthe eres]|uniref:RRM domain-containing protein n=1 Tax=Diaporthe vaccinii TaxID=105482 RepID=A0ABR4EKW5_9PEZI|nr:hypothetical protein LA080_007357 [Diaporthe eres]
MSDKKTPDAKKSANKSRSNDTSPSDASRPSPLVRNSLPLAENEARTSNTRFGAIGGPTTPISTQHAPLPFRHATSLANLSAQTTTNQRQLKSNRPGASYVLDMPTWRRDPGSTVPAAIGERRPGARPADNDGGRKARDDMRAVEYQEKALQKYNAERQQKQQDQQLVPTRSQGFDNARGFNTGSRGSDGGSQGVDDSSTAAGRELFKPMNAKLDPEAANRPLTEEEKVTRDIKGISHRYQGDSNNPANESADIPEHENCSVWITNLPPDCTYRDLLAAIAVHHPGKVFATFISPPSAQGPNHLPSRGHSAAKVVFYYPWSAQHLLRVASSNRLWVRYYLARAVPNRIRAAPQAYENHTTRCLEIEGPADVVNEPNLRQMWEGFFDWHDDEVRFIGDRVDWRSGATVRRIVWRFGSHRAQAVAAMHYMRSYFPDIWVFYATDPCDVQVQRP